MIQCPVSRGARVMCAAAPAAAPCLQAEHSAPVRALCGHLPWHTAPRQRCVTEQCSQQASGKGTILDRNQTCLLEDERAEDGHRPRYHHQQDGNVLHMGGTQNFISIACSVGMQSAKLAAVWEAAAGTGGRIPRNRPSGSLVTCALFNSVCCTRLIEHVLELPHDGPFVISTGCGRWQIRGVSACACADGTSGGRRWRRDPAGSDGRFRDPRALPLACCRRV